ncbi:MAG: hypothetical protein U0228_26020 [Myxococcaceae bacterium]
MTTRRIDWQRLRTLGLLSGDEVPRSVLQACHEERLTGGLSLSLRATADEVVVWLANAMGGRAKSVRLLDVRTSPAVMEVRLTSADGAVVEEQWPLAGLEALISRLNDEFAEDEGVRLLAVLGEFEGMLQVWALRPDVLELLLDTGVLEGARNEAWLRDLFG